MEGDIMKTKKKIKMPTSKSECGRLIIQTLPKSKHPCGYTAKEVEAIFKKWGIPAVKFWTKFGVNTVNTDSKTGKSLFFYTDVERTLRACINEQWVDIEEWD